ncbi:MAG: 3-oxocholest-4-en-26-oate---CoA ligase [Acidimicrobiaceae bacterium]|nr:3-oxocholest-4-en-26-oate---CoA ligase [Acidimicrobiaceae bacterium]
MPGWNFADVWEVIADVLPDAPAQIQGERRLTWQQFDQRADGVARRLLDLGVAREDKVSQYLYNCPEYLESTFACMKAGLVPVNTNYRYAEDELVYLWDNADAVAVIFHGTFADRIAGLRERLPKVRLWLWVDDGSGPCPAWAEPYEGAASARPGRTTGPWGRDGDDIYMLSTGGTTGMPKGVMYRQDDLFSMLNSSNGSRQYRATGPGPDPDLGAVRAQLEARGPGPVTLPAPPLMHGTGGLTAMNVMNQGGAVVTLEGRTFDVEELLDTIQRERVNSMAIVGDAFAKPMLAALEANPGRWDITSLFAIMSSGVMWSQETKEGLLRHHPRVLLADMFSSSEALGMGTSVSTGGGAAKTAKFTITDRTRVLTEDGRDVVPGSGEVGMLAVRGFTPIGYYKDPEKSARTFREIDGHRWSIPGDFATVDADGTLQVLGRGSVCINTGGEKVYPEEVEEVLKTHPSVRDAVVVGVPDDRFGEAITAMVEPHPGGEIDEQDVIRHVKSRLSAYKAPKRVFRIDTVGRSPSGKVDYKRLKADAEVLSAR